jgi:branched-chain amino acid transport system permease protein
MRGRPHLFTSYEAEESVLPTWTQRVVLVLFVLLLVSIPFQLVPGVRFMGTDSWLLVLNRVMIFGIAALGLNILTGLAGQVSLGHAFFMGIGAYTAVVLGAEGSDRFWGLGLPMWIWLPAAGLVAAAVGVLVGPTAVRVRGLYLAIVTLGLVFIGEHVFRNLAFITGGPGLGRDWPPLELSLWKGEPFLDFSRRGEWFGVELSGQSKAYFFILVLLVLFTLFHKNLARTRVGRAFQSIRDRDIAAEVMGVAEVRHKLLAFAISSFFAGVAGALLGAFVGILIPESWNLLLSVQFVAIILIGGAGTTAGTLLGSFFVVGIPRIVEDLTALLSKQVRDGGPFAWLGDILIAERAGDFGLVSTAANGPGLSIFQANLALYGLLIIVFLIFEPLGLFGIWIRIRNYWKGWPFSY